MSEIIDSIFKPAERRIFVPDYKQEQCLEYAENWMKKNPNGYSDTGQTNPDTIIRQQFCGKVAELATRHYVMKTFGIAVDKVDFNIYENSDKSWDADLNTDNGKIHVKSCCSQALSGCYPSWTFQGGSIRKRTDMLLREKCNDWTVFCEVSHGSINSQLYVDILAVLPWSDVKKKLRLPNAEKHESYKRVLYYSSLVKIEDDDGFVVL